MACSPVDSGERVVDRAIDAAGGMDRYNALSLEFDFRDRHYVAHHEQGLFRYERIFTDTASNRYRDIVTNDGHRREVNGSDLQVPDSMRSKYTNSVNSVIYFALLPFKLNDPAAQKRFVKEEVIEGEPYDVVEVTFAQEGGGEGHQDVFAYWFHRETHHIGYFGYYFIDGNETGYRFRKACNPQMLNGILLLDYINYEPLNEKASFVVADLSLAFMGGKLTKLSTVELENIIVR